MTNNINRIGINTNSVNLYQNQTKNTEAKAEEKETQTSQAPADNAQVNPNDVFAYMAQQAVTAKPQVASAQKTYDVQKYVTPEQAERIAGLMASFETQVAEGLLQIEQEPGLAGLSEAAKYEIAANMVA